MISKILVDLIKDCQCVKEKGNCSIPHSCESCQIITDVEKKINENFRDLFLEELGKREKDSYLKGNIIEKEIYKQAIEEVKKYYETTI